MIDVEPSLLADGEALAAVVAGAVRSPRETQVAVRGAERFTARIVRSPAADARVSPFDVLDPAASYLITGGLSGLGLEVAHRFVERGARRLVLVGRRAPSPNALDRIARMTAIGADVQVRQGDIAIPAVVAELVAGIPADAPLRGIVHCAGQARDAAIAGQSWRTLQDVFAAKVDGTWNLHDATRGLPLDFFVLFSSGASFLGSRGQSNYSAANGFLDAFAAWRRRQGLPASSINWGAWSEVGAATRGSVLERARQSGLSAIDPQRGLDVLEHLMTAGVTQAAVLPIAWGEYLARAERDRERGVFDLVRTVADAEQRPSPEPSSRIAVTPASVLDADPSSGLVMLEAYLSDQLCRALGVETLDPAVPVVTLGFDSLMAVEVKNRIDADLHVVLPTVQLIQGPSARDLAGLLLGLLTASAGNRAATSDRGTPVAEVPVMAGLGTMGFEEGEL